MTTVVASSDEQRPFVASRFVVKFGDVQGVFTDVSGLSIDIEEVESTIVKDGRQITRWAPGTVNYGELTLKREFTGDKAFWDWHMLMVNGKRNDGGYRDGSIELFDLNSDLLDSWSIARAWPSKWSASDLDSGSADPMIEEITIQLEYLQRGA